MPAQRRARARPVTLRPLLSVVGALVVLAGLLSAVPTEATAVPSRVTKVLTIVGPSYSLSQLRSRMPYTFAQAKRYGYASRWTAVSHGTLPNFLAIVAGSTYGISGEGPPAVHPLSGRTVFGQARALGMTAEAYLEGMPSRCLLRSSDRYAVQRNPWAYFIRERSACRRFDRSMTPLASDIKTGSLPNVGLAVPGVCPRAGGCPPSAADRWFRTLMTAVKAGPDWRAGRLAVVLTADTGTTGSGLALVTVVLHPSLSGKVVRAPLTHYSLTRFYDDVIGAARLNRAAGAPDLATAFGLRVGPPARTATTASAPAPRVTTPPPTTAPAPSPPPPPPPPPPSEGGDGQQAAVLYGWGPVVAGDEFNYTGSPDPAKWKLYDSPGYRGNGLRVPSAWYVDGSVATVTGDENGTTGGMSARFDHRMYGRWEVRMRTNARDPKYHPVALLWPDTGTQGCPEVDYAEASTDTVYARFFLHYDCKGTQTRAQLMLVMSQWHNYAVEWTAAGITGYVDGQVWFEDHDPTHLPTGPMHQTLQLDWFPDGTPTTVSTMLVDWVRVYDLT